MIVDKKSRSYHMIVDKKSRSYHIVNMKKHSPEIMPFVIVYDRTVKIIDLNEL